MKTVIEIAKEAGLVDFRDPLSAEYVQTILEGLTEFADLVRADEREAIIQEIPGGSSVDPQRICDMIRARGQA